MKNQKGLISSSSNSINGLAGLQAGTEMAVDRGIKNSKFIIIILVCIVVGTILLFKNKPTGFIPTEDDGRIYVTYDLPEASSTQRSVTVLHEMMKTLDSIPEIGHYAALGGLNAVSFASKSNSGTIFVSA